MSIENADYIHQLDISNPKPIDPISEGDNHIRLIKKLLVESFPSDLDGQIIPNITDNEEKYLRVNEDGTALEWYEIEASGLGSIVFRSKLIRVDNNNITIGPGEYTHKNHKGTLSWSENISLQISNPSGNFAYIYLDDSGTVSLSWSDTAPTWSDEFRAWYLDDKRCIGAVPVVGGQIKEFYHDGQDYIHLGSNERQEFEGANVLHTLDFSNEIPSFCETIQLHIHFKSNPQATSSCSWYTKPYNASEEIWVGITQGGGGTQDDEHINFTSRFTVIEGKVQAIGRSAQSGHKLWGTRLGFYLPRGI